MQRRQDPLDLAVTTRDADLDDLLSERRQEAVRLSSATISAAMHDCDPVAQSARPRRGS